MDGSSQSQTRSFIHSFSAVLGGRQGNMLVVVLLLVCIGVVQSSAAVCRYVDDVISRIDRMFPDMTIELFRPNGNSAVLLVSTHVCSKCPGRPTVLTGPFRAAGGGVATQGQSCSSQLPLSLSQESS